jgi:hypothetical protein
MVMKYGDPPPGRRLHIRGMTLSGDVNVQPISIEIVEMVGTESDIYAAGIERVGLVERNL